MSYPETDEAGNPILPRGLYAWNGTAFTKVLTDALGKLIISGITNPDRFDFIVHPYGKGPLTVDGAQYSAEVASIDDTYTEIEKVTVVQPEGYTLEEIEFGLIGAVKSSSIAESVLWKWQASDNGTDWEDLCAEQTRAASAAAYADVAVAGRFAPTGNFLGTGASFQVRMVAKSGAAAGETVTAKTKNSSYVLPRYRRT